ncbi:CRAL-TRIO domain-containing protein [Gymnopilus junonius]|uniref:CRAL-TRIO domain-containing protein n=1 Tax=Gymnopilus junonius TaxID=109634 RepID=A0A9P5NYL7_GYMJU|nr:CRAL-TRIO domain-containing protein [Gymnopilus junonius]
MTEKAFLPLPPPRTIYKENSHAQLSTSEQSMYDEVLAHFTRTEPVYTIPNFEQGELTDEEQFWLSRECLLRYLRASKWKVPTAIERLEDTLKWRRDYGVYDFVTAKHVEPEAVTGKEVIYGYDVTGRPAIYMLPSRQNTDEATRQVQFAVWMLERALDLAEPGVETLALLINFADKGKNPSVSTALTVLNILQNHYPERLGLALIINVPFLVNAFFKIVMSFVDPLTRQKVKFNPKIFQDGLLKEDMVMKEWGGNKDFEYVHEKYWPELVEICEKRVKAWKEIWRKLGAKVGISEWDYKTANTHPIEKAQEEEKTEQPSNAIAPAAVGTMTSEDQSVEPQPSDVATVKPSEAQEEKPEKALPEITKEDAGAAHETQTLPSDVMEETMPCLSLLELAPSPVVLILKRPPTAGLLQMTELLLGHLVESEERFRKYNDTLPYIVFICL